MRPEIYHFKGCSINLTEPSVYQGLSNVTLSCLLIPLLQKKRILVRGFHYRCLIASTPLNSAWDQHGFVR